MPLTRVAIAAALAFATGSAAQAAVVISSAATKNMSCSSGLCTPTAKNAVLNIGDLTSMLASGNVEVSTGTGSLAETVQDIEIAAAFNWSSANSLTLDSYQSIAFKAGAVVVNGAGPVALVTNDGGSGGELSFQPGASLSFASTANSMTINGASFALENSISTLASAIAADPGGNFAMANSYDASQDGKYYGSPIRTNLEGIIEGLGNTISNLSISGHSKGEAEVGLVSEIESTATVAGMVLAQLNYNTTSSHRNFVGGIAGANYGLVANDYTNGSIVVGPDHAGGLVGDNYAVISTSHAAVTVRSKHGAAGGLVALNNGTIQSSSAEGSVQGLNAGGLVGDNIGTVSESFASGRVASSGPDALLGGLAGISGGGESTALIENSYATGAVKGRQESDVGGLIGKSVDSASQSDSYSVGVVSGVHEGQSYVGGFLGLDESYFGVTTSYWNTTTSKTDLGTGEGNESGLTGLTTSELQSGLPDGFDPAIWREKNGVNHGFPYLINNPPPKE